MSLIVATCGRTDEVGVLLQSLAQQTCGPELFEVIIVDQNDSPVLNEIVSRFKDKLLIDHIRSEVKGLSRNRNRGLERAKGEIYCFPDDDCAFYPETVERALAAFQAHPEESLILGRVYDRSAGIDVIRKWPKEDRRIQIGNFFFLYTAITIFHRRTDLRFDEKLGVGTYFGSYEDADFVFRSLRRGEHALYTPSIEVWHPAVNIKTMLPAKVYAYGLGFGALVRKNGGIVLWRIFLVALIYHSLLGLSAMLRFNKLMMRQRWAAVTSRMRGAWEYAP